MAQNPWQWADIDIRKANWKCFTALALSECTPHPSSTASVSPSCIAAWFNEGGAVTSYISTNHWTGRAHPRKRSFITVVVLDWRWSEASLHITLWGHSLNSNQAGNLRPARRRDLPPAYNSLRQSRATHLDDGNTLRRQQFKQAEYGWKCTAVLELFQKWISFGNPTRP